MNRLNEYIVEKDFQKITEFVKKFGKPYDQTNDNYNREPFASDVKAGKNTAVYTIHSYHTKVPPDGIRPFIRHYTAPGDIVFDPFCGSGMTGIAALMEGRVPILIELSPAASFIAYNYCTPVDIKRFLEESQQILEENFIEEKGTWRNPTTAEKERLIKKVSDHTARQIDQYLRGSTDLVPTDTELCDWIEFCYRNGLYQEGSKLFEYVGRSAVDPETWMKTKKIAEICKNKLRE